MPRTSTAKQNRRPISTPYYRLSPPADSQVPGSPRSPQLSTSLRSPPFNKMSIDFLTDDFGPQPAIVLFLESLRSGKANSDDDDNIYSATSSRTPTSEESSGGESEDDSRGSLSCTRCTTPAMEGGGGPVFFEPAGLKLAPLKSTDLANNPVATSLPGFEELLRSLPAPSRRSSSKSSRQSSASSPYVRSRGARRLSRERVLSHSERVGTSSFSPSSLPSSIFYDAAHIERECETYSPFDNEHVASPSNPSGSPVATCQWPQSVPAAAWASRGNTASLLNPPSPVILIPNQEWPPRCPAPDAGHATDISWELMSMEAEIGRIILSGF